MRRICNPLVGRKKDQVSLMPKFDGDAIVWFVVILVAIVCLVVMLIGLAISIRDFSDQLKYINNEIKRTSGAERKHYLKKRRRLWLSLIPFVKR